MRLRGPLSRRKAMTWTPKRAKARDREAKKVPAETFCVLFGSLLLLGVAAVDVVEDIVNVPTSRLSHACIALQPFGLG